MLTLVCPRCGREKTKDSFIDGVCADCFFENNEFTYIKIKEFRVCKVCGRIYYRNKWQEFSEDDLESFVKENIVFKLPAELENIDFLFLKDKIKITLKIKAKVEQVIFDTTREFNISLQKQICPDCYKTMADYYEAKLQIRFNDEFLEKHELDAEKFKKFVLNKAEQVVKEQRKEGDYLAYVYKITNEVNGFDIYLGSKLLAIALMRNLKHKYFFEKKNSVTLIGLKKDGKKKVRHTYLLRFS